MYQTTIQPFWVVTQCRVCRNVPRSLRTQPRSGFLIVIVIATPKTLPRRIARVWHRSTVIMKLCCFEMRPCVQIFLHGRSIECCKCKMLHLSFDWGHGPKYRFELNCNVWVQLTMDQWVQRASYKGGQLAELHRVSTDLTFSITQGK